ncbi:MAG: DUF4263 domain-containing protein [Methylacidiphilales bacterium]|nr:DUF4263 domain-containing protein [Candidatus Methylacidiphilales bacterium]
MIRFEPCTPDHCQARVDLAGFRSILDENDYFGERKVLSYFKNHPSLIPFIPASVNGILRKDRYAHELNLFGTLKCDFAVGDSTSGAYCFIEFEDARQNSIFRISDRHLKEWSPRLEHAYSQVIDWFWQLDSSNHASQFQDMFGTQNILPTGMIVLGRNETLTPSEKNRLKYRKTKISIGGYQIILLTYDDLYDDINWQVNDLSNVRRSA